MQANTHLKSLSVRLPDADIRRFKGIAAHRGITLQDAVYQALTSWAVENPVSEVTDLMSLEGSLADVDVLSLLQSEKDAERHKENRLSS